MLNCCASCSIVLSQVSLGCPQGHKGKADHVPVWSVGGVLISLSVAIEPIGG